MAKRTVKLKVAHGTDEVNADGQAYRVDNDDTVEVPEEAVAPLLEKGGCVVVDEAAPVVPKGFALLEHDDPNASVSHGERDGNYIRVPLDKVNVYIQSHGFRLVNIPAAAE
jgi:hypothetical protein